MENLVTPIRSIASDRHEFRREHLLKMLSAATFLIVFQGYMVAPLIPRLFLIKLDALRGYDFEAGKIAPQEYRLQLKQPAALTDTL